MIFSKDRIQFSRNRFDGNPAVVPISARVDGYHLYVALATALSARHLHLPHKGSVTACAVWVDPIAIGRRWLA